MHNIHFLIVSSDSPQEACNYAEGYIEDWGNENNWRTIVGCVSEDNEVHTNKSALSDRYLDTLSDEYNTIEKINELINTRIKPNIETDKRMSMVMNKAMKTGSDWAEIEYYAQDKREELYTLDMTKGKKFDVFKHAFREYQYDYFGNTIIDEDRANGEKMYVVLVDMHS
jgi:hypothetical protein